jgi:hypothetical protein
MYKGLSDRGTNTCERDEKKKKKNILDFFHEAVAEAFFYLDDSQAPL